MQLTTNWLRSAAGPVWRHPAPRSGARTEAPPAFVTDCGAESRARFNGRMRCVIPLVGLGRGGPPRDGPRPAGREGDRPPAQEGAGADDRADEGLGRGSSTMGRGPSPSGTSSTPRSSSTPSRLPGSRADTDPRLLAGTATSPGSSTARSADVEAEPLAEWALGRPRKPLGARCRPGRRRTPSPQSVDLGKLDEASPTSSSRSPRARRGWGRTT